MLPTTHDNLVLFNTAQSLPGRATLLGLTRHSVALEVHSPSAGGQLSEVLHGLRIMRDGRPIYEGRAVVTARVPAGNPLVVSATLVDEWADAAAAPAIDDIAIEAERFVETWQQRSRLRPRFQIAVNNLASFLQALDRWLAQAEGLAGGESLFERVWPAAERKLAELFVQFELGYAELTAEQRPLHDAFAQRELHPLLLCDPFIHHAYTKPLGYAGDYRLVNMILENSEPTPTTYARIVSQYNLTRAPAQAHRNRVQLLQQRLREEATRKRALGGRLRVLNIGCGPAAEVERFVAEDELAHGCELTLVDFNAETLAHAQARVTQAQRGERPLALKMVQQSIQQLLKAAASGRSELAGEYDLVYCAGLFDYLSDRTCQRLVELFCSWTAPGGLALVTNVHSANPIRYCMAILAEWDLEYREETQFAALAPPLSGARVYTDATGINLFMEIRRPAERSDRPA